MSSSSICRPTRGTLKLLTAKSNMTSMGSMVDLCFFVIEEIRRHKYGELDHEIPKEQPLVVHLKRETGLYLDLNHFEDMVVKGKSDEAENYLPASHTSGSLVGMDSILFASSLHVSFPFSYCSSS
ncbi:hypothetical protein RJT34_20196 [Clitoria ternatea]|uniref:Uncharacterized protein n=1 Tax=Clitoria ternatea TaxID=43366 RepID=A0AAN9P4Q9_CLITE